MSKRVPFIGRKKELALIGGLIKERMTSHILCIDAPGGVGKTRLLQEVYKQYSELKNSLIVTDIIDFDDYTYHIPENIWSKISKTLSEKDFEPYVKQIADYQKMKDAHVSSDVLNEFYLKKYDIFTDCFNRVSDTKKIVLLFDTTEALSGTGFLSQIFSMALKNVLILIAGRNAKEIGNLFRSESDKDIIRIIELPQFRQENSRQYFQHKKKLLHVNIDSELGEKLLILSDGKPILIDLAVEWISRNIPFGWLKRSKIEDIYSLEKEKKLEFEGKLISPIINSRSLLDTLTLLMAHVYPLDKRMISDLLKTDHDETEKLYEEIKKYVYTKILPGGKISLHDEMRRMINDHVWQEVDPDGERRRTYSQKTTLFLKIEIQKLYEQYILIKDYRKKAASENVSACCIDSQKSIQQLDHSAKSDLIKKKILLYKELEIEHTLFANIGAGLSLFNQMFDDATRELHLNFRERLIEKIKKYEDTIPAGRKFEFETRFAKYLFDKGEFEKVRQITTELLTRTDISKENRIEILLLRGNTQVRLGDVTESLEDFSNAAKISKDNNLTIWLIKSLNALGWAYRLTGDLERAKTFYLDARRHCLKAGGPKRKDIAEDYGLISNNLAFILANRSQDREVAIDIALTAIEHWNKIGYSEGKGLSYLVLGNAYYRDGRIPEAQKALEEALRIFDTPSLKLNEHIGHIYSWLGAIKLAEEDYFQAENYLKDSLRLGSKHIRAMTLYRLGRLYITLKKWDEAEKYFCGSIESAKKIPDYVYWLSSVARIIYICAQKKNYHKLDSLHHLLEKTVSGIKNPINNAQGIAYLSLARLAIQQNHIENTDRIIEYLKKAITFLIQSTSHYRIHMTKFIDEIKNDFKCIGPQWNQIKDAILNYCMEKEIEDVNYSIITPVIASWSEWNMKNPLQQNIVLGMSSPFSGLREAYGTELYRGSMAYFEHINATGGIQGKEIRILAYDDGFQQEKARENTLKLIEKNVLLLMNYKGTPAVLRILDILEEHKTTLFFPYSGVQKFRQAPDDTYVFNLRPSYHQETKGLVDHLIRIGKKRIAVYHQADAYGRSGLKGVQAALDTHGIGLAGNATYRVEMKFDQSFHIQVDALKKATPDVVICIASYMAGSGFIRDARNSDWDVPIANISAVNSGSLLKNLLKLNADGTKDYTKNLIISQIVPDYRDDNIAAAKEYRELMGMYKPTPPKGLIRDDYLFSPYSEAGFEGFLNAKVIVEVLRRMGDSLDKANIIEATESIKDLDIGIGEKVSFGPGNHQGLNTVYYTTIRNEDIVPLEDEDWKVWA